MLHAYIDESGDRGLSPKSSDHFVLSAAVVRDSNLGQVPVLLDGIRSDLRKPAGYFLHWKNLRNHADRVRIAQVTGVAQWLRIASVVACKRHLPPTSISQNQIYLYQLRMLLERLSWLARTHNEVLTYTIAQVPRLQLTDLRNYEAILHKLPGCQIHWPSLDPRGGSIDQPQRMQELQLADFIASATGGAFNPDRFGNVETRYANELVPRLYRHGTSPVTSYGLKMHPWNPTTKAAYPWVAAL